MEQQFQILSRAYQDLVIQNEKLAEGYQAALYEEHLGVLEKQRMEESKAQIEAEYQRLMSEENLEKLSRIEEVYSLYQEALSKIERNNKAVIDTRKYTSEITDWGVKFINQEFNQLKESISNATSAMEKDYKQYLAALPTPTPKPLASIAQAEPTEGYSHETVSTEVGRFNVHLIKLLLSLVQVKTVAANEEDCTNNCPTKSLSDYVNENNAYAGIHGTYFCPPDYASCQGKVNSYDFAVYNSSLDKWLNETALDWNNLGLATFNRNSASFYKDAKSYEKEAVTAGIENFLTLLSSGEIVVDEFNLTSNQNQKGPRGAIGVDGENIYLAIVSNATVSEAAYVMQALGAKDALNLDGGGSSAMYMGGSYKAGPGRDLPNAVLLLK